MGVLETLFGPPTIEKLTAKRDVRGLIKSLRYRKDPQVRRHAASALGALGGRLAVQPLLVALHDADSTVRVEAAVALGKLGDPRAIPPLLTVLEPDNDWIDREKAVKALGELRRIEAVMPLVKIVQEESISTYIYGRLYSNIYAAELWVAAVDALGAIGDAWAMEPLLGQLQDVGRFYTIARLIGGQRGELSGLNIARRHVINALAGCGRAAVSELVAAMDNPSTRYAAALALTALGWKPQTEHEQLRHAIACGEWDKAAQVGASALESLLSELGFELKDGQWISRLEYWSDAETISSVAHALGAIGDARAVDPLIQILSSELKGIWNSQHLMCREAAAQALGRIGEPAVQPLVAMIDQPDIWSDSRVDEAANALALCGPNGLTALAALLREHSEAYRRYVARTRRPDGSYHSDYGSPDYPRSKKWLASWSALVSAGEEGLPTLKTLLNDENPNVRSDAADILAKIKRKHS